MSSPTIHPDGWKPAKEHPNEMIAEGRVLFIGGQIGWTARQVFETTAAPPTAADFTRDY